MSWLKDLSDQCSESNAHINEHDRNHEKLSLVSAKAKDEPRCSYTYSAMCE